VFHRKKKDQPRSIKKECGWLVSGKRGKKKGKNQGRTARERAFFAPGKKGKRVHKEAGDTCSASERVLLRGEKTAGPSNRA